MNVTVNNEDLCLRLHNNSSEILKWNAIERCVTLLAVITKDNVSCNYLADQWSLVRKL